MESGSMGPSMTGLFHLEEYPQSSAMLSDMARLASFLRLNNII
jgi:hypothetical protein